MKKILITLFLSLTACIVFAQTKIDSSAHLTFKGVPLDGTLDQYVVKMKQNGFKQRRFQGYSATYFVKIGF